MTDVRLTTTPPPTARPKPITTPQPSAKPPEGPALAGDRLQTQTGPGADGVRIIQEALAFPAKPKKGQDMTPWLMDAYSRMLTAETTLRAVQRSRDGVDASTLMDLRSQLWDAQRSLTRLDRDGAVKMEFFQTILPPAHQLIDALENYPAAPAEKAGKAEWLADAKQELARAKAADDLMNAAWFDFKALDFGKRTETSRKIFDFESRVRQVEYELNPPAPRPSASGAKAASAPGQLFGNIQGAANLANSQNPVNQVAGAVALPFAVTLDVIDLITRPLRWLDEVGRKP